MSAWSAASTGGPGGRDDAQAKADEDAAELERPRARGAPDKGSSAENHVLAILAATTRCEEQECANVCRPRCPTRMRHRRRVSGPLAGGTLRLVALLPLLPCCIV